MKPSSDTLAPGGQTEDPGLGRVFQSQLWPPQPPEVEVEDAVRGPSGRMKQLEEIVKDEVVSTPVLHKGRHVSNV